jgi:hypothetical protein
MDMKTTGAEKAPQEKEGPRKPGRPPPILKISTTNLFLI